MNPILEAALCRPNAARRNSNSIRIPRLFWYLRSRRARWLRQSLTALTWAGLAAGMALMLNA